MAGMVSACYLKKAGFNVTVLERNATPGGRARTFSACGFNFDMGPSWYWMPEVFEQFFEDFGHKRSDFYSLARLDPSYDVYFEGQRISIPAGEKALGQLFEQLEPGAGKKLEDFLKDAASKYALGLQKFATKPSFHFSEFFSMETLSAMLKLQLFRSMERHVNQYFKHPLLRQIMQFPVIFLGAANKTFCTFKK
jgi:phytoene desaturase